ncbi:MAG TPA: DUF2723 domain-containing protein [Gemmatimonadales bacterium]|nr:DUF2723 domain-containing protein [Gemmatimonadales bacterium]
MTSTATPLASSASRTAPPAPPAAERPPYWWALATGLVIFLLYVLTLAPTTAFWDTSEYIAAAKVLGIPHPPGNPLFVLMAHTWGLLPLAASYAERINLFAAATSAGAAACWFLVAERWLRTIVPVRWVRLLAAFMGVFVGATAWTVWNQSTVNEKVYTVSLLSIALVAWLAVHYGDLPAGPRRDRLVVAMLYILALSSTNHMMGVLGVPVVIIYVLMTDWRIVTRPWVVTAAVGAVLVGVSVNYGFLPIRAGQFPPINEGEPTTWAALNDVLNRAQYGKPSVTQRQADFVGQIANYLEYWGWQFARDWGTALQTVATALFSFLGLWGLYELVRRDKRAGLSALALLGTLTVALIFYLNFKYGFSQYPDQPSLPREVRERDYFFVASFQMFGVLVALGLGALVAAVVRFLRDRGEAGRRWALASPVLALGLIPLVGNHVTAPRSGETIARDFAIDMLESIEPYGILITAGDNDTFPLWYAQEVEGVRPDVTLANLSLMNTRWHLRQLRRRPTPTFDLGKSVALWGRDVKAGQAEGPAAGAWPKPTTPVFSLSEGQLDSLPEIMPVQKGAGLQIDSLQIVFGQDYLTLQDIATLFLIKDNLGKRPIYFAWSDGGYPDQTFGLTPYLVSAGLVRKLHAKPVEPSDSIMLSSGLGFMNLPRTRRLLWEVYHWQAAAKQRPRGWVDPPSASILQLYSIVYGTAADALRKQGFPAEAQRADSVAHAVQESIRPGTN